MKKAKLEIYDAHKDYETELDLALLNTKIKIYGVEKGSEAPYFEGTVGKFVKERIPSDELVAMLPKLKVDALVEYQLATEKIRIEKVK